MYRMKIRRQRRRRRKHYRSPAYSGRYENTGGSTKYGDRPAYGRSAGRRAFSMAAWTASFIMILNMIPSESPAGRAIRSCTENIPALGRDIVYIENTDREKTEDAENKEDKEDDVSKEGTLSENVQEIKTLKMVVSMPDEKNADDSSAEGNSSESYVRTETIEHTDTVQKTVSVSSVTGSGNIIIYHTHATEAYEPVASTTTHTAEAAGTVREAGTNLTEALKAKGFSVVHDTTLHDSPSYNKSYNRSLETSKKLISAYGNIKYVIDLHRDAASSAGGKPKTVVINGETVSSFALVVGTKNANYTTIRKLADDIAAVANRMYPGFCTGVIEKPYKFNGYLSDRFILLELGNNANTIEQVNAAVPYLADVLANAAQ